MNRTMYRPVYLSAMLGRAHELATHFPAEAAQPKDASAIG